MEPVAGTPWSAYGGGIHGWTLEAEPGVRLVLAWRAGNWPAGQYSLVRWDLEPVDGGTRATLTHTACPDGSQAHLESGWDANYWSKLSARFSGPQQPQQRLSPWVSTLPSASTSFMGQLPNAPSTSPSPSTSRNA